MNAVLLKFVFEKARRKFNRNSIARRNLYISRTSKLICIVYLTNNNNKKIIKG